MSVQLKVGIEIKPDHPAFNSQELRHRAFQTAFGLSDAHLVELQAYELILEEPRGASIFVWSWLNIE